jgi:hypothetical protein
VIVGLVVLGAKPPAFECLAGLAPAAAAAAAFTGLLGAGAAGISGRCRC